MSRRTTSPLRLEDATSYAKDKNHHKPLVLVPEPIGPAAVSVFIFWRTSSPIAEATHISNGVPPLWHNHKAINKKTYLNDNPSTNSRQAYTFLHDDDDVKLYILTGK